jgi:hypothetical protein
MHSPTHKESPRLASSTPDRVPLFSPAIPCDSAAEVEMKNLLRELLEGVETVSAREMELLVLRRDLLLRRQHLYASKASYSLKDWKDLLLICLLQKRALLRDQDMASVPTTVPFDPIFRAKTVLLFQVKDYLARQKWRKIWTIYKEHPQGQKVLNRIKAVNAIYEEQHSLYQELLDIQTLFLQPLSLMADAGFVQRQDVNNAFHISAILTLQQVMKELLDQERQNWPRSRFARSIFTKSPLMQQLYCTYTSDTNVALQSLRRLVAIPAITNFLAEVISEHPSLFSNHSNPGHSSTVEAKIQILLERPLSHVSRILAALKGCLPFLEPDHFLHEDTVDSVEAISQVHTEISRIRQDATLALISFDSTVSSSCTPLFFCNPGTSIKKLGDVEMLVEKTGIFGSPWKPVTLLLCDGLLVVFRATGTAHITSPIHPFCRMRIMIFISFFLYFRESR